MAFAFNATAPVRSTDNFYETEEERQRRLAMEAGTMPPAPVTPESVTPVKQTITTDPVTGERRIKIEGSERDLSAANPLTPTLVPAQPQMTELPPSLFAAGVNPQDMRLAQGTQASPGQMPQLTATTPQLQPAAQPVAEQMPVAAPAAMPQQQLVTPAMGASSEGTAGEATAQAAQQGAVTPASVAAPAAAPAARPGLVDWDTILSGSVVNDRIGLKMLQDPNTPVMYRMAANSNFRDQTKEKKDMAEAKSTAEKIIQSGDSRAFEREMKKEGSLFKAVFFGALGAKDIARNELDKLGYGGGKWQTVTDPDTGKQSLIKYRTDGMPMEGFDQTGAALTSAQLASAGTKATGKIHSAQTLIDPVTKQVVTQQVLADGSMRYYAGGKPYAGDKNTLVPESAFTAAETRKIQAADRADDKRIERQEKAETKRTELQQKAEDRKVENAIKTLEKRIPEPTQQQRQQALISAGIPTDRIEQELGLVEGSLDSRVPVAPARPAAAGGGGGGGGGAARPVTPAAVSTARPPPRDTNTIGQLGPRPVEPNPIDPGPGQSAEAAKARNKTAQDTYKAELASWEKQKQRFDKRSEELPDKEAAVDDSIALVDRFIKHPGFASVVGVPGVTGLLNLPLTDARGARALYNQIDADTFLRGFERLRGGGSITETEGAQAKQAVAALRDRYITEDEFKKNAELYINILKRGVNRERQQLGYDPRYSGVPEVDGSGDTAAMTPQQKAAAEIERRRKAR